MGLRFGGLDDRGKPVDHMTGPPPGPFFQNNMQVGSFVRCGVIQDNMQVRPSVRCGVIQDNMQVGPSVRCGVIQDNM